MFAEFVREFRPALLRYFSRRVRAQHEVEDLVHDVLVRLVRNQGFADTESVRGYLFQTANSVLVDAVRRRASLRADHHVEFDADMHADEVFGPDHVLQARQELTRATTVVMELPELTRTIFVLRRLEGMKYKDIAARLGMSLSTVEKHMQRAVMHVVESLDERDV